jgi:response regulator RpfG family c-di-GMP phosphodiesterase/HAMP domain-containing protein
MSMNWFQSLRTQIGLAVFLIFLLLVGTLAYTLHALNLRQHDYLILNLTGQLRVLSQTMTEQSINYVNHAPENYYNYDRDLESYLPNLQKQVKLYDKITHSLESRVIDAELGGHDIHSKVECKWDDRSRLQMDKTASDWKKFKKGLDERLGPNTSEPRLTYAAQYISQHGHQLIKSSEQLAMAFKQMMEQKLDEIRTFQWIAAGLGIVLLLLITVILQHLVFKPLNVATQGFRLIANGNFKHQLPVTQNNEIGQMTNAFNHLTERLSSMFKLADRINQGKKLEETLQFIYEEFQSFVPFDWVGVFFSSPDHKRYLLERCYSPKSLHLKEGDSFDALRGGFALARYQPKASTFSGTQPEPSSIDEALVKNYLNAAVFLPLLGQSSQRAVMVFASNHQTFQPSHVEFLSNLGGTVTHILEKTLVVESLVASAIEGLAKLAESRDPETGDHLLRMAYYSAIIAEELGRQGPYMDDITPAYVRDIFQFAPMHDIGKVGIRDNVLLKPGLLDPTERKEIEQHPLIGGEVLRKCEAQMEAQGHQIFQIAIEIAECHHEKFNGSGYPRGLKGQAIPLSARIVMVADVFDALTSKRPYKEAWSVEQALDFMKKESDLHFDPVIIEAMEQSLPRMLEIYHEYKHV